MSVMKSVPPKVPRELAEFAVLDPVPVFVPVPVAAGVPVPVVGRFVGVVACVPLINMVRS
jgi:hypothetical protein